ncbi:MAG: DNA internalization-related competence protein ComEC/Rec2 [Pseudomonadales bacterium]
MALLALPWSVQWLTAISAGMPILLLPLVVVCWRRNQRDTQTEKARPDRFRGLAIAMLGLVLGLVWAARTLENALAHRWTPLAGGHAQPFAACVEGVPERLAALTPHGAAPPTAVAPRAGLRLYVRVINDPEPRQNVVSDAKVLRQLEAAAPPVGHRLRLVWFDAPTIKPNSCYRFSARLRAPHGAVNPAGFDAERWMFATGIDGTGTVLRAQPLSRAKFDAPSHSFAWSDRARLAVADFFDTHAPRHGPVLSAQVIGQVSSISAADWGLFRATGTVHLMVISGLHITLAAGVGFLLGRVLGLLCPPVLLVLDAAFLGALSGALCGALYVALAGEGVAIARAALMVMPALVLRALGWRTSLLASLRVAAFFLLVLDPRVAHAPGFWLSVGAVLVLALKRDRVDRLEHHSDSAWPERGVSLARSLWTLVRLEWFLTVLLAPLLILLTTSWPLAGLPANLVAVPVMTFLVLPLALLAALLMGPLPGVAIMALELAETIFGVLHRALQGLGRLPLLYGDPSFAAALLALVAGLFALLNAERRLASPLLLAMSTALLPARVEVPEGEFRVTALDVGQGDAILVDTRTHRLLFDTGPGFPDGTDRVASVILPSIVATGPARLDAVIVSHADLDHAGGAGSLEEALAPERWIGAWPTAPWALLPCHGGAWVWDRVRFRLLTGKRVIHAPDSRLTQVPKIEPGSNDDSCILEISNGRARVLLPGDISVRVEALVQREVARPLDLIVAPHHGSRSSSSRAFVRLTGARTVWFSAGQCNRYGHPHPDVVARYLNAGARVFVTANSGALTWSSVAPHRVHEARSNAAYWRERISPTGSVSN